MKLFLAKYWLYWIFPSCGLGYYGGMALLAPIVIALPGIGEILFYALPVAIVCAFFWIKSWAEETVSWHESVKRLR